MKYNSIFREKLKKEYTQNFLSIPKIAKKYNIPPNTLYRFKKEDHWEETLIDIAKTMYLEQKLSPKKISKIIKKPIHLINEWKKQYKWDNEIYIIGNIGLSRELNTVFIQEVKLAIQEKRIAEPATADKLTKLLKIIEKLTPQRIQLANIFQLLQDLTEFIVSKIDDPDFAKLFQKHLPEMANYLREKYATE